MILVRFSNQNPPWPRRTTPNAQEKSSLLGTEGCRYSHPITPHDSAIGLRCFDSCTGNTLHQLATWASDCRGFVLRSGSRSSGSICSGPARFVFLVLVI